MYQQFNSICLATIMHHTKEIKWLINFNHELYSLKTLNKYNCLQFAMYSRDILSPGVQNSGHANTGHQSTGQEIHSLKRAH